MESNPRATLRAHGVRPLGLPRPVLVHTDARGEPTEVTLDGRDGRPGVPHAVEHVDEVWCVAEAWWRAAPIRRTYYRVLIDGGRPLTLFRDDGIAGDATSNGGAKWYEQRY